MKGLEEGEMVWRSESSTGPAIGVRPQTRGAGRAAEPVREVAEVREEVMVEEVREAMRVAEEAVAEGAVAAFGGRFPRVRPWHAQRRVHRCLRWVSEPSDLVPAAEPRTRAGC